MRSRGDVLADCRAMGWIVAQSPHEPETGVVVLYNERPREYQGLANRHGDWELQYVNKGFVNMRLDGRIYTIT